MRFYETIRHMRFYKATGIITFHVSMLIDIHHGDPPRVV